MNDMENKYEELRREINDKYEQLEALQMNIQELEEDIKQYSQKKFDAVLEKANAFLNKYYLYYNGNCDEFNFCYCKKITKTYDGVEIELASRTVVNKRFNMMLYYENPKAVTITSENNYLNYATQLNGEQAYQVQDEINKTSSRERSVRDLHSFLRDMYNTNMYNNID